MSCLIANVEWETLLVGILGFGGVILTIIVNAWIVRKDRKKELRHRRQALRTALKQELRLNFETIKEIPDKKIENLGDYYTHSHLLKYDILLDIYNSYRSDINILTEKEIFYLLDAYLMLTSFIKKLDLISIKGDDMKQPVNDVIASYLLHLRKMSDPIEKAIKSIEKAIERDSF